MTITLEHFKKIADLAYLDTQDAERLLHEANVVLKQIDTLHDVDTTNIEPLIHPLNPSQTLRVDEVTENSCVDELAHIAPTFVDSHYLVPSVMRGK